MLPLDPRPGPYPNHDGFIDSLWNGLAGLNADRVAILWPAVDDIIARNVVDFHLILSDMESVAEGLLFDADWPRHMVMLLSGDGPSFPDLDPSLWQLPDDPLAVNIVRDVETSLPRVHSGALQLFGDWFGGRPSQVETVAGASVVGNCLSILLADKVTVRIWGPRDAVVCSETFLISGADRVRVEWPTQTGRGQNTINFVEYIRARDAISSRSVLPASTAWKPVPRTGAAAVRLV